MKYLQFKIKKYKAIDEELEIDIHKSRLVPIIGINECGKTTILHGIFSFDYHNDSFDDTIHHLKDVKNLYKTGEKEPAVISAKVSLNWNDFLEILTIENIKTHSSVNKYKKKKAEFNDQLIVSRNLLDKKYSIESCIFTDEELNNLIAKEILRKLPYILFFDDFRDSFPDAIDIKDEDKNEPKGWTAIIERLFVKTNSNFSIFSLPDMEQRERSSVISQVQKSLNETLTEEWKKFNLSKDESLKISITFEPISSKEGMAASHAKLKFDISEADKDGKEHFFYIRDRSKGFFGFSIL